MCVCVSEVLAFLYRFSIWLYWLFCVTKYEGMSSYKDWDCWYNELWAGKWKIELTSHDGNRQIKACFHKEHHISLEILWFEADSSPQGHWYGGSYQFNNHIELKTMWGKMLDRMIIFKWVQIWLVFELKKSSKGVVKTVGQWCKMPKRKFNLF